MFKKTIILFLVICICSSVLAGCREKTEQEKVEEYFWEFVELYEGDTADREKAIKEYMYHINPIYISMAMDNLDKPIDYLEMESIQQLSDNLWAIEIWATDGLTSNEPLLVPRFVGIMDGEYRIFGNVIHIPEELTKGLDLEPYTTPGAVILE